MTISQTVLYNRLGIEKPELVSFCQQWQVAELALFGSILTNNFGESSDIDLLVTYLPTAKRGLLKKIEMKEQLEKLTHRKIDLVSKKAVEKSRNWVRRSRILAAAEVFYVA